MADVSETDGMQQGAPEAVPIPIEPRLAIDELPADVAPAAPAQTAGVEAGVLAALEARVRRLEAELVAIQDTRIIEDRVVARVSQDARGIEDRVVARVNKRIRKTQPTQIRDAAAKFQDDYSGEAPSSPADDAPEENPKAAETAAAAPVAQAVIAPVAAVAPVAVAAVAPVAAVATAPGVVPPPTGTLALLRFWLSSGTAWLFLDSLIELRCMWRMLVDPRYRLSWGAKLMPIVLLALIATSWFWLPGITIISGISATLATLVVKAVDLLLAFFLYKVLGREVFRYRQTAPDLPAGLRL